MLTYTLFELSFPQFAPANLPYRRSRKYCHLISKITENKQLYSASSETDYKEREREDFQGAEGRNVDQNRLREGERHLEHETLPVETIQPIVCHCIHCHRSFTNKAVKVVPKEEIFIFFRPETHEDMIHSQEKVVLQKL
jgi:hypothetical protein